MVAQDQARRIWTLTHVERPHGYYTDILLDDGVPHDERGVEGEAAGFRAGEWMEIKVICTARVPIVNIVLGGFPFLRYDDAYAAAIAEANDTSNESITFECDVRTRSVPHVCFQSLVCVFCAILSLTVVRLGVCGTRTCGAQHVASTHVSGDR